MDLSAREASDLFEQLDPVRFIYKADPAQNSRIGLIAEEVPDILAAPEKKGVDTMGVAALLAKIVREQQKQIHQLQTNRLAEQKQIKKLQIRLTELEAMVEALSEQRLAGGVR